MDKFSAPISMRAVKPSPQTIAILPLGIVNEETIKYVEQTIRDVFGTEVLCMSAEPLHSDDYALDRNQFKADNFLRFLPRKMPKNASRIIAITESDMYGSGRTFVYGFAHIKNACAVVSTARLKQSWYDSGPENDALMYKRIYACVVHELGHTYGALHCEDAACIMHAVSNIEELDGLSTSYCSLHQSMVCDGLAISPKSHKGLADRAEICYKTRRAEESILLYESAIRAARLSGGAIPAAYYNDLGVAYLDSERYEAAEEALLASDRIGVLPHPCYNLGILCARRGRKSETIRYFTKALLLEKNPDKGFKYVCELYQMFFAESGAQIFRPLNAIVAA